MNISGPFSSIPIQPVDSSASTSSQPGFADALARAVENVNDSQNAAHQAMEELSTGRSTNLHETMIAIQKAEISFKMLMQVRNKVMNAYQEIMRMQA